MKLKERELWKNIGICAFFLISATLVSYFFFVNADTSTNAAICYTLAIFFIARFTSSYKWGFISSVIGVVAFNFIFAFPYFAIDFFQEGYPLTFAGMLTISLITSAVTTQLNNQKQEAMQKEKALASINQFNKQVLGCKSRQELLQLAVDYLSDLNGCSVLFWPDKAEDTITSFPYCLCTNDVIERFEHSRIRSQAFNLEISSPSGIIETLEWLYYYLPVYSPNKAWGTIFICYSKSREIPLDSHFNELIIPQIALSLEHFALLEQRQSLILESEKEKMRSNLLRAVSHDLRTPLTGMIGASSTYLDAKDFLDEPSKDQLIQGIHDDANWLLNMVENLLSITKIDQTRQNATVTKQPEPLEEVVSEALVRFQKRYPEAFVNVMVPEEFLMVPMDATLIEQVIINLLENAVVHGRGQKAIDFHVEQTDTSVIFHIRDYGKGIPDERIANIFDGYTLSQAEHTDAHKGMGIGLSICKTIILAHQGKIDAISHKDGAEFLFQLPL